MRTSRTDLNRWYQFVLPAFVALALVLLIAGGIQAAAPASAPAVRTRQYRSAKESGFLCTRLCKRGAYAAAQQDRPRSSLLRTRPNNSSKPRRHLPE